MEKIRGGEKVAKKGWVGGLRPAEIAFHTFLVSFSPLPAEVFNDQYLCMSPYDIVAMCLDANNEHAVVTVQPVLQTVMYDSMLDHQVSLTFKSTTSPALVLSLRTATVLWTCPQRSYEIVILRMLHANLSTPRPSRA
jgi:hypothetical protein